MRRIDWNVLMVWFASLAWGVLVWLAIVWVTAKVIL